MKFLAPLKDPDIFADNSFAVWLVDVVCPSCKRGKTHCIQQRRRIDDAGRESEVECKRSTEQAQKKPPARLAIDLNICEKFSHFLLTPPRIVVRFRRRQRSNRCERAQNIR